MLYWYAGMQGLMLDGLEDMSQLYYYSVTIINAVLHFQGEKQVLLVENV